MREIRRSCSNAKTEVIRETVNQDRTMLEIGPGQKLNGGPEIEKRCLQTILSVKRGGRT